MIVSDFLVKSNSLIDQATKRISEEIVLPTVFATYEISADVSIATARLFSETLSQRVETLFYDPFSTSKLHFFAKSVVAMTCHLANRKPKSKPHLIYYFDRSLISVNQHLHDYAKKIHELLKIPNNCKDYLRRFSVETTLERLTYTYPTLFHWANYTITTVKRFSLAFLDAVIQTLDLIFRTFFLGVEFGLFSYVKEVVTDTRNNIHGRIAETGVSVIEKKEAKLRKDILARAASKTCHYIINQSVNIGTKSLLGLAIYLPVQDLISDTFYAKEWMVHLVGAAILSKALFSNVVRPTLDPYYESYQVRYKPNRLSYQDFFGNFEVKNLHVISGIMARFFQDPKGQK